MSRKFDPAGKVAVITGGGSGIGQAIARALVEEDCRVVVADLDEQAAVATAEELRAAGGETLPMACDVAERGAVEALADQAWAHFGQVDLIVNNAGIIGPRGACIEIDEAAARQVMEVNFFGVWHGCSVFGRRFVEQGTPAHILNTGSENSLGTPVLGIAAYTASKHALLGLSDVLRQELPAHIGISLLCPGIVATKMSAAPRDEDGVLIFGLEADEIGRRAVAGLRDGQFYIMTHAPVVELVQERAAELSAAFAAQAPRFEGDDRLDTRAAIRALRAREGDTG